MDAIQNLRGYATWGGGRTVPSEHRAPLRYKRFTMRDLWPEKTRFDWAPLDAELDRAARDGERLALRLRDMAGKGAGVPDWMIAAGLTTATTRIDTGEAITIPKYASADYQALVRQFVLAVAKRLDGRAGLVDIGMLGMYGEGHFWNVKGANGVNGNAFWMPPITVQQGIVDLHREAFPDVPLLALTGPKNMCMYALSVDPRIGWRRDSLGNGSFDDIAKDAAYATLLKERAKSAPVMAEFWNGTGDAFTTARARAQAAEWGVWLIGNGNLGKAWTGYSATEQADLLAIGAEAVARTPQPAPTPQPTPAPDPQADLVVLVEQLTGQVITQTMQIERLAGLLAEQGTQIVALQQQRLVAETTIRIERAAN